MSEPATSTKNKWTTATWLVCIIAAIGFAFDIYELLMLPLIIRPALLELGNLTPGTPEFNAELLQRANAEFQSRASR